MPQTKEAIEHAQAAGVPIIVAINKMDKPGANPDRVKTELTEYNLVSEDWGGDTIFVNISALTGKGVDELLEMIILVSDLKEYKANLVRQTITASTSKLLRRYLKNTVEEGTAKKAGVTGYSVAGKTGTAQKGDRKDNKWIISFIGHAPAENPKFAIYVVIDEPYGTTGTSGSSADVLTLTHNILEKLLPYMNVYKDASDEYEDTSSSPDELTVDGIPAGTASSN